MSFKLFQIELNVWVGDGGGGWSLSIGAIKYTEFLCAFRQTAQQGFLRNVFIHIQNSTTGFIYKKIYSVNIRWVCRSQNHHWTDPGWGQVTITPRWLTETLFTYYYQVDSQCCGQWKCFHKFHLFYFTSADWWSVQGVRHLRPMPYVI